MNGILTLTVIAVTIWSVVALYWKQENTSWLTAYKTALEKIVDFFKDDNSASEEVEEITFPVYIGIDEFGYVHADVIEQVFHPVLKNFVASYFENFVECYNRFEYHFYAYGLKLNFTDEWTKISYLRDIAEQVVHQYIHKNYPFCGRLPNNLVALNLQGNQLLISVEKNNTGMQENINYMDMLRKKLKQISLPENPTVVDDDLEKDLKDFEE